MQFPHDVDGWLTEAEGEHLFRLAQGKRVLEIGSYCGRSTVCLAQGGAVVSIDPHDGRGTPEPRDTYAALSDNLRRYGVWDNVIPYVGTTAEIAPTLQGKFGLVFIDGAHDLQSVRTDIEWAVKLLEPGGVIAFHDYRAGETAELGVSQAVDELVQAGGKLAGYVDSLVVILPPAAFTPEKPKKKVILCMPRRPADNGVMDECAVAFYGYTCFDRSIDIRRGRFASSILPLTFDVCWVHALTEYEKGEATHFAMLHDDVCPRENWLGILLDECDRLAADVVSAVVPLKDQRGLTSTAIDDTGDIWNPRRLSMKEIYDRDETFTDPAILLNTGCWVADLSKPWTRAERGGVLNISFHQRNRIIRTPTGWQAQTRSEDWEFSRLVRQNGGTGQYATRKVSLFHEHSQWSNAGVWGTCQSDPEHTPEARDGRTDTSAAPQREVGIPVAGAI